MDRDRTAVNKIISKMLDNPGECEIYPTSKCYDSLIKYIEKERAQGVGWMYGQACSIVNKGEDLLEYDFANIYPDIDRDLNVPLSEQEISEL